MPLPAGAVHVTYPTKWQNPYRPATHTPEAHALAVELYREHLDQRPELKEAARLELRGKDLCCYCKPDLPCHADVLLEIANDEQ